MMLQTAPGEHVHLCGDGCITCGKVVLEGSQEPDHTHPHTARFTCLAHTQLEVVAHIHIAHKHVKRATGLAHTLQNMKPE